MRRFQTYLRVDAWFRLLVCLLVAAGTIAPTRALFCDPQEYLGSAASTSLTDFDGDGIGDVGLHTSTEGVFLTCFFGPAHDLTNRLSISGGTYGEVLVDKDSRIPLFLTPGDRVRPAAPAGAEWQGTSGWLLETYTAGISTNAKDWQIGPLLTHDTLWAGVRFRTVFGTNYGWMKLTTETNGGLRYVRLVTNSYNPLPESPVTVGDMVPSAPVNEHDWTTNQPVRLLSPLDLAVETRRWRDQSDLNKGMELTLRALIPSQVLARVDTDLADVSILPVPLTNYRRIPRSPANPEQWVSFQRIPLLSITETLNPSTGVYTTNRTGLLASRSLTIGIKITNASGTARSFPLLFDVEGNLGYIEVGAHPFPVVGVKPFYSDTSPAEAFDLNDDGRIDFMTMRPPAAAQLLMRRHETTGIQGLGDNCVISSDRLGPLAADSLVSKANGPGQNQWSGNALLRFSEFSDNPSPLDVFLFTRDAFSYLGVKFAAADGIHLGWFLLRRSGPVGDFYVVDYSYNPTPDEPIRVGQRMAISNQIRISQPVGNELLIEGEVFGLGWTLSRANKLPVWQSMATIYFGEEVGENRFSFRIQAATTPSQSFFRLDLGQ